MEYGSGKMEYKVITCLFPSSILFIGESWECWEWIENKYGNGLTAALCTVKKYETYL